MGFLPPISSETCFIASAPTRATRLPTSVEPVNEITLTSGWRISGSPTLPPPPVTILITPSGAPASSRHWTRLKTESGVSEAGLITTVLPTISAGRIFHEGIAIGKFQGVIRAQTPSGWRTDIWNLFAISDGV